MLKMLKMLKMLNKNKINHLTTQNIFVSKYETCIIKNKIYGC